MDAKRFDRLVMTVSAAGTRRGVLHLLTALPLGGWLAVLLDDEESAAKRRKKSKQKSKRRVGEEEKPRLRARFVRADL
jgi:hypothetical protein